MLHLLSLSLDIAPQSVKRLYLAVELPVEKVKAVGEIFHQREIAHRAHRGYALLIIEARIAAAETHRLHPEHHPVEVVVAFAYLLHHFHRCVHAAFKHVVFGAKPRVLLPQFTLSTVKKHEEYERE